MSDKSPRFSYKGSKLKPLRAFCQVAKLGSVSRAAESLFLTQPAVSQQLQALERELGVELVMRQGRALVLTKAGDMFYDMARPLVEGIDRLDVDFRERLKGLEVGELHVVAGSSTAMYLLPSVVEAFRQSSPDVRFNLHTVTGEQGLEMLRKGKAEVAVGSMLDMPQDLDYARVWNFDMHLIAAKDHPLAAIKQPTLANIAEHGFILPPQRLTSYRLIDRIFQQHHLPLNVTMEVGGWEVIKEYVLRGLGVSLVTGICLTNLDRQRLHCVPMGTWFPPRTYGVIVRKGKFLSPAARVFVDAIKPGLFERMDYYSTGQSGR